MKLRSFAVAAVLSAISFAARADTVQFGVNATGDYNGGSLTGTFTVDTTAGTVSAVHLDENGTLLTSINSQGPTTSFCGSALCYEVDLDNATFVLQADTLVGYTGSRVSLLGTDIYRADAMLIVAATPEPPSLLLLGTGLVALAGIGRFRRTVPGRSLILELK